MNDIMKVQRILELYYKNQLEPSNAITENINAVLSGVESTYTRVREMARAIGQENSIHSVGSIQYTTAVLATFDILTFMIRTSKFPINSQSFAYHASEITMGFLIAKTNGMVEDHTKTRFTSGFALYNNLKDVAKGWYFKHPLEATTDETGKSLYQLNAKHASTQAAKLQSARYTGTFGAL